MSSSCMLSWFMPFVYLVVFFVLGVFIFAISKISKRNVKMYEDSLARQKEMMDRQKEAVDLLRQIRDLLNK